jgi:hypothetical protein
VSNYIPAPTATTYGYSANNQNQSNGFAVAALILGILPTGVIGIIFGILGLVRAGKVGGKGRAMSWIGIVLSVLWIAGASTIVVLAAATVSKSANPGCVNAVAVAGDPSVFANTGADPDAFKAQLTSTVAGLNTAAAQSTNAEATTAIKALARDYKALLDAVTNGQAPSDSLSEQLAKDADAVNAACGLD